MSNAFSLAGFRLLPPAPDLRPLRQARARVREESGKVYQTFGAAAGAGRHARRPDRLGVAAGTYVPRTRCTRYATHSLANEIALSPKVIGYLRGHRGAAPPRPPQRRGAPPRRCTWGAGGTIHQECQAFFASSYAHRPHCALFAGGALAAGQAAAEVMGPTPRSSRRPATTRRSPCQPRRIRWRLGRPPTPARPTPTRSVRSSSRRPPDHHRHHRERRRHRECAVAFSGVVPATPSPTWLFESR